MSGINVISENTPFVAGGFRITLLDDGRLQVIAIRNDHVLLAAPMASNCLQLISATGKAVRKLTPPS